MLCQTAGTAGDPSPPVSCIRPVCRLDYGGLETLLFTLLLTVSGYLFVREEEREKGWLSGLTFGLLALARPDGLLFAGVAGAFRLWRLFQAWAKPTLRDITRLVTLMAIVIPYYLWRFSYYGYWLPNTVYALSQQVYTPDLCLKVSFISIRISSPLVDFSSWLCL